VAASLLAAVIVLQGMNAFARDVQRSECVGPVGAPVKVIYFHGLFPDKNKPNDFYLNLESANRDQLEGLANNLKIRIAIPLAKGVTKAGYRDWRIGATDEVLASAEKDAEQTCNAKLEVPRTLVGFSAGGYYTRNLALECSSVTKDYAVLFMTGAQPHVPSKLLKDCNNLVVASGTEDSSTDVCRKVNKRTVCTPFKAAAQQMQELYPNLEIETFLGGHQLPPDDMLTKYFP
jgi:hypothetical protein